MHLNRNAVLRNTMFFAKSILQGRRTGPTCRNSDGGGGDAQNKRGFVYLAEVNSIVDVLSQVDKPV